LIFWNNVYSFGLRLSLPANHQMTPSSQHEKKRDRIRSKTPIVYPIAP
jgi:hypothetical protein